MTVSPRLERDRLHAGGAAAHRADVGLVEADGHAAVRADEDLVVAVRRGARA